VKGPSTTQPDDRTVFGIAAFAAFAVLCLVCALAVRRFGALDPDVEFSELVLIGLACLRLIHLVTYDKILDPLRERLETGQPTGLMRLSADFVRCVWCSGMWAAVISVTLYFLGRWGRLAVLVLAVAALGTLLQVASRAIAGCTIEPGKK
jgi:hypothetical protein